MSARSREVDPALVEISALSRDLVVQAGAGTGKTHALVTLYLHLLTGLGESEEVLPPSRVLVITFTDKAATELRERIRARVGELVERGLDADPVLADSATRRSRSLPPVEVLRRALRELPRAPIGTFHSFGHAFLRRHALVAGIAPDVVLLDEADAQARATDAARAAVLDALDGDPVTARLVEIYGFEPFPGAGIVAAVARLRSRRAEEGRGAAGMAAAYSAEQLGLERETARTALREALMAFGALEDSVGPGSQPRRLALQELGRSGALDDEGCWQTLESARAELKPLRGNQRGVEAVAAARARFTAAAAAFTDAHMARDAAPLAARLEALIDDAERRYREHKRREGRADYADLLVLPRDLLRDRADVARAEGRRYGAILVDEFQDTSRVQAELVERLAAAGEARRFVVGDRKQAIYEFRGADVAVFTERTEAMRMAGAGEVVLRRSFRSAPGVVALCNALFARAFAGSAPAAAWALRFDPARDALTPVRPSTRGASAELLQLPPIADHARNAESLRRAEARAIARRMRTLVDEGKRAGDLVLLLRRYTHLPLYLEALRRESLPHYVVRGRGLYQAQEVRDLAAMIAWLADEDDRLALVSLLRSPLGGLSDDGIAALSVAGELGAGILRAPPAAPLSADDREALTGLVDRANALRALGDRASPPELLREIIELFDLRAIWAAFADGAQRIANLELLVARVEALAADPAGPVASMPGFARWLGRAVRPLDTLEAAGAQIVDERDDVVRVMTIHQAKGLEFGVVFVADCGAKEREQWTAIPYDPGLGVGLLLPGTATGKLVPTSASRRVTALRAERQRAESLRLFYVATTRAKDRVIFSGEAISGGSWREEIDRLLADPETASLIEVVAPAGPSNLELPLGGPAAPDIDVTLVPLRPRLARGARIAVTQLQDFALCQRRYHLFHELRLDEHPHAEIREVDPDEAHASADPLRTGTLAHRLLERMTFAAPLPEIQAEVRRELAASGYSLDDPAVAEVEAHVLAFAGTDFAKALGSRLLRRELPFALSIPAGGGVRVLRGQIDLLAFSDAGVDVVDYKHARRGDLAAYTFQLEAYALAAATLYPLAPRVRVGLSFLREASPEPVWVELPPVAEIGRRLGATLEAFVTARLEGERPGVDRATCERIRCGYLSWCHGS